MSLETVSPRGAENPLAAPEEELIPDARAHLRPAEMVQERLVALLKLAALPVGHTALPVRQSFALAA